MTGSSIAANLAAVRGRLEQAARTAGRNPADIRLVAISKTFPPEAVRDAFAAGQVDFGENRVQEALQKIRETAELHSRWHLVGHLQTNKARKVVGPFAYVHSVDSLELLTRLDQAAAAERTSPKLLIQVDLAGEATKFGAGERDLPAMFDAAGRLQSAQVVGLMVLPPYAEDPEDGRPWFKRLREIRDGLIDGGVPPGQLGELSMGMSHDFHVAVEEGATIVRVGTAIFGTRAQDGHVGRNFSSGAQRRHSHMKVTPLDLRQQKFKTVMRGYDRAEVESFLNETAEDYEQALREADRLRDDLTRLQSSLDEHREGERNLRNTLLTAQKLADEIRNNAEAEGKRLVREAEGRSDLMISKAQARLDEVQREIDGLRLKRRDVENSLESTIQTLRNSLEFVREQDKKERDEKILLHRPRPAETQPVVPVRVLDELKVAEA